MQFLSPGLWYTDLRFLDTAGVVAAAVVYGDGVALVDPGPASTLPTLESELASAGIGLTDVTEVLLTHVHLDHAGVTGTLLAKNPKITVCVHESGAPHLTNPLKLLASVTRLLGEDPGRVFGECRPVPISAIKALRGGEKIDAGGRRFEVLFTPGHASHHVSYFEQNTGVAFVGDVAAMKLVPNGYVLPPTPPPDIDIQLWGNSLVSLERLGADTLFLTHFGPTGPSRPHLAAVADNLDFQLRLAKASLERDVSDQDREEWFVSELRRELQRQLNDAEVGLYESAARFGWNWKGLARLVRNQRTR